MPLRSIPTSKLLRFRFWTILGVPFPHGFSCLVSPTHSLDLLHHVIADFVSIRNDIYGVVSLFFHIYIKLI